MHSQAPIRYRVRPLNPAAHTWEVEMTIDSPAPDGQRLIIPAWIPGSYMIRDFSRTIVTMDAYSGQESVGLKKLNKDTWLADPCSGPLTIRYSVYGWEMTVRHSHLDQTHGYFNGTSLFFWADGMENEPCEVELLPPTDPKCIGWRVATSLTPLEVQADGFGSYQALNYDELIDHPVEMGTFVEHNFDVCDTPHRLAITGHVTADLERFSADLVNVCAEHIALFDEAPPMPNYLFMLTVLNKGYGGLEHRNSTSLICQRPDLPQPKQKKPSAGYKKLMGLCSHEYFHLWNIKRIKPEAFTPYDLTRESYTTMLWWFEGITSYYDDLALVRSGVFSQKSYYELLGQFITRIYWPSGRLKQTLAESSYDAWTKFYKQDENAPNSIVSYYAKGSVVGLCLDLMIRSRTQGAKSLDDVTRTLWQRYGKTGIGIPEEAIPGIVTEVTGLDLTDFFQVALHEHGDLPVVDLLKQFGIIAVFRPQETQTDLGGAPCKADLDDLRNTPNIGAKLVKGSGGAKLLRVYDGGSAQKAGLAANDIVIAADGLQVNHANLTNRIAERHIGTTVKLHAFRRDVLMEFDLKLQKPECNFVHLIEDPDATESALKNRREWLASNKH